MAELRLDEVVLDAIIAKLQAGWPDRIGQINAEKVPTDLIACNAPPPEMYFVGRQSQITGAPAVFVLTAGMTFKEQGAHALISTTEVHVHIIESAQTGPELARRLMRQVRCVIEVLYDDPPQEKLWVAGTTDTLSAFTIRPVRTIPGPVFQPSGPESWRGSIVTVFRAEQEEI